MRDLIVRFGLLIGLDRLIAWLEPRLQRALEWLGFTPTQREVWLNRRLLEVAELATSQRIIVGRVEVLLRYREKDGATSIDVESLREALFGEGEHS